MTIKYLILFLCTIQINVILCYELRTKGYNTPGQSKSLVGNLKQSATSNKAVMEDAVMLASHSAHNDHYSVLVTSFKLLEDLPSMVLLRPFILSVRMFLMRLRELWFKMFPPQHTHSVGIGYRSPYKFGYSASANMQTAPLLAMDDPKEDYAEDDNSDDYNFRSN